MDTPPIIRFQNLSKTYGKGSSAVEAVVDLNLEILPGQVYGFLGRNGAGKTTTIRLLLGLIHPTRGQALLSGVDVQRDPDVLHQAGALVEDPSFYNFMNGRDNLKTLSLTHGEKPAQRIDQLLELVGLRERAGQRVSGYSKGMRQRLGIAAALLNDPQLVILDEPTNGLDPKGIQEIRNLIRKFVDEEGKTVFISSHILNEVEQICDRVAIIHQGRIIQEGSVAELLSSRADQLRIQANPTEDALNILLEVWPAEIIPTSEDPDLPWIQISAPPGSAPEILKGLIAAGIEVHQVIRQNQKLEELFLELTDEEENDG